MSPRLLVDPNGGGTHSDLQAGIDAAPAGGIVEVRGGSYGNIVVTKSLTITAFLVAMITSPPSGAIQQPAGITCTGAGGERLTISNFQVLGLADGVLQSRAGAGISVADFALVEATDCLFEGHVWRQFTGDVLGAPGVEVTSGAPLLHLTRSTVEASNPFSTNRSAFIDGVPGIQAPQSIVVLTESTVTGGGGFAVDNLPATLPNSCPCPNLRGHGGPGVNALETYHSQSLILGGQGANVYLYSIFWGRQPDGSPFVGPSMRMRGTLPIDWNMRVNGGVHLELVFGKTAFLMFGTPASAPTDIAGGKLWLDPQASISTSFGVTQIFRIPNDPSLIGVRFGLQFLEITSTGLVFGRPHLGVIRR